MNKEFLPYEQALALKELGFDEPCLAIYDNITDENDKDDSDRFFYIRTEGWPKELFDRVTPVPLFSQAFRWFREEHYLISSIYQLSVNVKTGLSSFEYMIDKLNNLGLSQFIEDFPYNTYEEAELACLEKLIEIVESKTEK